MTSLNEVQGKLEDSNYKMEQTGAIAGCVRDIYEDVAEASSLKENKEFLTYYEFERVKERLGLLLSLLDDLLLDTTEMNREAINQLREIKIKVMQAN